MPGKALKMEPDGTVLRRDGPEAPLPQRVSRYRGWALVGVFLGGLGFWVACALTARALLLGP